MKTLRLQLFTVTLVVMCFTLPAVSSAQEATQLAVDVAAVCEDVVDLEPIGTSVSFPVTLGRLCCFTRISGAYEPTTITHVWYYGMDERARVALAVKGDRWRTYSSKIIQAHEVGSWRVEVLDPEGAVLKVMQFITTSGQETLEAQAAEPLPETDTADAPAPPDLTPESIPGNSISDATALPEAKETVQPAE